MKLKRLLTYGTRAIKKYQMIDSGDKIAVGLSGGKDSLATLIFLSNVKKYFYKDIEIIGIAIDCFGDNDYTALEEKAKELEVSFKVVRTEIADIIFNVRKEKNPCSLCSKMRKSALFEEAKRLGCNKVALGHNKDDVLETFFMSLFEEGRIHTFPCIMHLDKVDITIIRPLIYAPEREITGFINKYDLNKYIIKNKCLADGNTERESMKLFLKDLRCKYENVDDKLMKAIEKANIDGYED